MHEAQRISKNNDNKRTRGAQEIYELGRWDFQVSRPDL